MESPCCSALRMDAASAGMALIQPMSWRITGTLKATEAAATRILGKISRIEAMLAQAPEKG